MHSWRQVPRTGTHRPRADRTHGVREGATRHLPRAPARRAGATASATGKGTPHTDRAHGARLAPQQTQRTGEQGGGHSERHTHRHTAPTARTARATRQSGRNAPTARICAQGGGHRVGATASATRTGANSMRRCRVCHTPARTGRAYGRVPGARRVTTDATH